MKTGLGFLQGLLLVVVLMCPASARAAREIQKLSGTPISSQAVDYGSGVQRAEYAFDGDLGTFYASQNRSNTWVGLDLGTQHVITNIGFCPRKGYGKRVLLGLFEGANSPDFLDAVPLHLIAEEPGDNGVTLVRVGVSRGFRYVRYVGPHDVRCNIAEVEFYGYESEGDDTRFYQVTNLPTLSIHTYSGADITSKDYELEANITITYDGCRIQEYPILARGRGNASWGFPKKPYRIKFNDGKGHHMFKDSPLESPAKAKKWTLINNYGDKTLMRNIIAFEMSHRLQMPYTPYCQPVDVILNGEYRGCYQLCDQITIDPNRVPITEMEETDETEPNISGGYLVEVDAYAGSEASMFYSSRNMPVTIKAPSESDITTKQQQYIRGAFNRMESAVWSSNYTDETTGYRHYLDVESILRHFIVGEFSGNTDTYWSTYMYKNRSEDIFTVAPVWDFDLAFDNDNRIYPVSNRNDWVFRSGGSSANGMSNFVSRILKDPYADKRLKQIWKEMVTNGAFSTESMLAFVDSMANVLDASQRLNFLRWPILNETVHQNVMARGSYEAEVDVVRKYLRDRIQWISDYLGDGSDAPEEKHYIISTPQELIDFAKAVNAGASGSTAELTADIDMNGYSDSYAPIGSGRYPFKGTFDGKDHRILNLNIVGGNNFGVFGSVTGGATICNLVLDGSSSIQGGSYVGIVGVSSGNGTVTIDRVGNEAYISGNQNTAGIIGCDMGSSATFVITNCYNTGTVAGTNESGAITGWMGSGGTMSGCWNIGTVHGTEGSKVLARFGSVNMSNCFSSSGSQGERLDEDMLQSGELCFRLNEGELEHPVWFQTLGTDGHPVLESSHGVVYPNSRLHCDGTPYSEASGYTNNAKDLERDEHVIVDGICSQCGKFVLPQDEDGYFQIATAAHLKGFANYVNKEDNKANAVLMNDIDISDLGIVMIGSERHYAGTFDGAGHTITIRMSGCGESSGLFRMLDGTVQDLTVTGDLYTNGKYAGGICGQMFNAKLLRCHSAVRIHSNVNGDGTHGGIAGLASEGTSEIESCLFSGLIEGDRTDCCGGFVGWASSQVYVSNSLMIGEITVGTNDGDIFCRNNGNMIGYNCYYLQRDWYPPHYPSDCYETTSQDMADGILLAQLNRGVGTEAGNWKQNVGVDLYPVPGVRDIVKPDTDLHLLLANGWNWISHNRAEAQKTSEISDKTSIFRSQTDELFLDSEYGWVGNLDNLQPLVCYKVKAEEEHEVVFSGELCDMDTPMELHKGWNWIGVPFAEPYSLTDALANYSATEGDRLVGQTAFATYEGGAWRGSLSVLEPGKGYMLQTVSSQKMTWEESVPAMSGKLSRHAGKAFTTREENIHHAYPNVMNMIVTAELDGINTDGLTVGAFAGDECRGQATLRNGISYLTVSGEGGEKITLRLMDSLQNEYQAQQNLSFQSLELFGSYASPFVLTFDESTGISSLLNDASATTSYFTVDGLRTSRPVKGVTLRRTSKQDGTVHTEKIMY